MLRTSGFALQGINYQMIWAMGETTPNISKAPPGSVNINTASDRNYYKQDVLMYHGGGTENKTDVTSPFRGTLGNVDLFAPPLSLNQDKACSPSMLVVRFSADWPLYTTDLRSLQMNGKIETFCVMLWKRHRLLGMHQATQASGALTCSVPTAKPVPGPRSR